MTGRVSIIMPVLNCAGTLRQALSSVLSQPEVGEVVFVDDGSTDGSPDIARQVGDCRVRIVQGPRAGCAAAFKAGLDAARRDYVAECDGDDFYRPRRLEWQVAFLDRAPGHVAVAGAFASTDSRARIEVPLLADTAEREVRDELLAGRPASHFCAWLLRRETAMRLGGMRQWFTTGPDLDLQYRAAELGEVLFMPRIAYVYRLHGTSITHRESAARNLFYQEQARRFAVQRRATGTDDLAQGHPPTFMPNSAEVAPMSAHNQFAGHLLGHAHRLRVKGERASALRAILQSIRFAPLRAGAWRSGASILADMLVRP